MRAITKAAINCMLLLACTPGFGQTKKEADTDGARRPEPAQSRRLSESPSRERRNTFGFSVGVMGLYDSNVFSSPSSPEGKTALMLTPRVFANAAGRRSALHLDYQFGERLYPSRRDLDTQNHEAGLEFNYQASRRTSFSISDRARYGPNDILPLTSSGYVMTPIGDNGLSQQIFFDRQRMWMNTVSAGLSHHTSRRNLFQVSGHGYIYRYLETTGQDTSSAGAGISDEYQFSRNWSFVAEASNEWVNSRDNLRDGRVLHLLGGLRARLDKNWEIALKGGGERVDYQSNSDTGGTWEASIARSSSSNRVELRYYHRSGYQLGLGGLNRSDYIDAAFDQRVGSKVSLHFLSRYYRTARLASIGRIETLGGSAGLDFAIHPSIVATIFGHYLVQRQGLSAIPGSGLDIDRYILYAGLYYVFPSVRREARSVAPAQTP